MSELSWAEPFFVHSYDADMEGRLSVPAAFRMLQEAAWRHAEDLSFGYTHLNERGQMWVLTRIRAVFYTPPRWGDEILVETWPAGLKRLFALRDFRIYGASGETAAEASSSWVILDTEKARPVRPERVLDLSEADIPPPTGVEAPGKLECPDSEEASIEQTKDTVYSDFDVQKHVNNVQYLSWMIDAVGVESLRSLYPTRVDLSLLQEIREPTRVRVLISDPPTAIATHRIPTKCGVLLQDGTPVAAGELAWEDNG
jgi:acyl-ACP thioesterase